MLGILLMNAVAFKFGPGPYFNLSAGGSETWLDWTVGVLGEIFIDQKFMGLFSLLFGAGMILFIDRAASRGRRAVGLNLWRNVLLLLIGILHSLLWYGDVLMAYAIASFFLVVLRKLPNRALISVGAIVFALSIGCSLLTQNMADTTEVSLSGLWTPGDVPTQDAIAIPFLTGLLPAQRWELILIGAGLYRTGFMNGGMPARTYHLTSQYSGSPSACSSPSFGVVITAIDDYSREIAFIGQIPNTLGTIPASLGYMSLIILWNNREDSWLKEKLRATGRMALTNYLTQTVLGVLVLTVLLRDVDFVNRAAVLLFVVRGVGTAGVVVAGVAESLPVRTRRVALASRHLPEWAAAEALWEHE